MSKIIIDCHNICYRAFHTTGYLDLGIVYGFLKALLDFAKTLESSQFIFCWDSRKSFRKELEPTYKLRPPKTEEEQEELEEALEQFTQLRKEVLPNLGFRNIFLQPGYEADDLIAHIVQRFPGDYTIVSGDEDLYQLLNQSKLYKRQPKLK